ELGLIDEYEFVVHPRLAGHGPTLFAGLSKPLDLKLVSRLEFGSGAGAMRYAPRRGRAPPRLRYLWTRLKSKRTVPVAGTTAFAAAGGLPSPLWPYQPA